LTFIKLLIFSHDTDVLYWIENKEGKMIRK
jgi:hypothetical protein